MEDDIQNTELKVHSSLPSNIRWKNIGLDGGKFWMELKLEFWDSHPKSFASSN